MDTPSFPKRDPASADFWDLRYAADFQPWDARGVPQQLAAYIRERQPRTVLVPGCGSARDVRAFAHARWDVIGIDFSAAAVAQARRVLEDFASSVVEADFFAPLPGEPFDLVYERAFLCALPRALWPSWAARVAQLVRPGGELARFFFFGEGERGPPFPLRDAGALDQLLAAAFERIEDAAVPDSIDVFRGRERWQRWRRR